MITIIIIAAIAFVIGALTSYIVMKAENRSDRNDHREAYADAMARKKNAEFVARKYAELTEQEHSLFLKHGYIRCSRCGQFIRYADAYEDRKADAILCRNCAAKSLSQKDVKHV